MEPNEGPFKAFVGNLPFDATQTDIEAILNVLEWTPEVVSRCEVKMIRDRETDKFKGFAYVQVPSDENLQQLLGLNGADFDGRRLKIDKATAREKDNRGGGRGGRGGRGGGGFEGGRGRGGGRGDFGGGRGDFGGGRGDFGGRSRGGGFNDRQGRREGDAPHARSSAEETPTETIDGAPPPRWRLNLAPRTTDPAALTAKRLREEQELAERRAKIFGDA